MSMYGDNQNDDERVVQMKREDIQALEAAAAKAKDAERIQRENTLLKLGVDTDSAGGKLLLANNDLDWSKPEEIKQLAEAVNAIRKPAAPEAQTTEPPAPETVAGEAEHGQTDERRSLAAGAAGDTGVPDADPYQTALERQRIVMGQGGSDTQGLAAAVAAVREAGLNGDARVIHDRANPRQHFPPTDRS